MSDFNTYIARHGEIGVQAIVESIERREGIRTNSVLPLELRWKAIMQVAPEPQRMAA